MVVEWVTERSRYGGQIPGGSKLWRCAMDQASRQCIKVLARSRRSGVERWKSSDNSVGMTIDTNERL